MGWVRLLRMKAKKVLLWHRFKGVSVVLIITLIAGGVSLASFAREIETEGRFGNNDVVEVWTGRPATSSQASRATPASLAKLLEQESDTEGSVVPTRFQVMLDVKPVVDSDNWGSIWQSGQLIAADAQIRYQLTARFYPQYGLEAGDGVTWNLGRMEGLDLEPEFWEPLVIRDKYIADIWLYYTRDGEIYLYTEFCEEINEVGEFIVTYWYDSGFRPVEERTELEMDLPEFSEPVCVILLPEYNGRGKSILPVVETTAAAETTAVVETTAAVTKPAETLPQETSGWHSENDFERNSGHKKESDLVPETSAGIETGQRPPAIEEPAKEEVPPEKEPPPPMILAEAVSDHGGPGQALPDEIITYRMTIKNNNKEAMEDVRIRSYLADRTSFVSVEGEGVYGVMNGKQSITWNLAYIAPGGEQELNFRVKVFSCVPVSYSIDNRVSWQAGDKRSVNNQEDLLNEIVFPEITVG